MKTTINYSIERKIEVPNYFRAKESPEYYGMTLSENSFLFVKERLFTNESVVYPSIEIAHKYAFNAYFGKGFTSISEAEFKNAYIRTSLTLERLLN